MQAPTIFQIPDGEQPENWFLWVAAMTQGFHERADELYMHLNRTMRMYVDAGINDRVASNNQGRPVMTPQLNPIEELKIHLYTEGVLYGRERLTTVIRGMVGSTHLPVDVAFNRLLHAQWPIARPEDYTRFQEAIQSFFLGRVKTLVPA